MLVVANRASTEALQVKGGSFSVVSLVFPISVLKAHICHSTDEQRWPALPLQTARLVHLKTQCLDRLACGEEPPSLAPAAGAAAAGPPAQARLALAGRSG